MKEGFDVGLEMSGNPQAFRDMLANMCHGGKIAMLGIPTKEMAIDWPTVDLQHAHHQGHLRPRDVRNLVQDDRHAPVGPGHQPDRHPPLPLHRVPERASTPCARASRAKSFSPGRKVKSHVLRRDCQSNHLAEPDRPDPLRRALQGRTRAHHAAAGPRRRRRRQDAAQPLRQQLPRPGRPSGGPSPPPARRSIAGATAWPASASSAARRSCTSSWSGHCPNSSAPKTRFSIPPAGTPTAACSRRSSAAEDAVISDELNHASIIDGVRLCKAQRLSLPQQRHGRPGGQAPGGPRGPLPPDRHRRRLLDGRRRSPTCRRSASWPTATTPW